MDERVGAFLADVLALEGEEANAIRQGCVAHSPITNSCSEPKKSTNE
jgi:hypothetical protein